MFSFIETRLFSRLVQDYLSDQDYCKLQGELIKNPKAGSVVSGSGGVRKLRWAASGRGKRAGYRVIYFVRRSPSGAARTLLLIAHKNPMALLEVA